MAVEKGKVMAKLDAKYKGTPVTKNFKEKLAESWAAKIDTDDDIDAYIDDRDDVITASYKDADQRVSDAIKKATEKKTETDPPKKDEIIVPDDAPQWAKDMMKTNQQLMEKITGFETQNNQQSIAQRFDTQMKSKGVPASFYKGQYPKTEEEFDAKISEVETDYTGFAKDHGITIKPITSDAPPAQAFVPDPNSGKVDPDLMNFAKTQNEAAKATVK